jgi:hypothetical protein
MRLTGPGDQLATTIRGALAYVRRVADQHSQAAREVLKVLPTSNLLIGVTGTPGLLSHEPCIGSIYAVADDMQGLIFDGANILSSSGDILVSCPRH